ncbi:MAG: hypothetical protein ACI9R3_005973, partial [Verrucomicrobiales bacterium]
DIGLTASALPFVSGLPSLFGQESGQNRKQRLVIMFTPNGTLPDLFWPDATESDAGADFELKPILKPLEAYKKQMLIMKGVCNRVGGDGDNHMRGMSCLLTGARLNPGNIQGGSHTPAGWSSGISIDQQIKNHLQSNPETRTRFGSLEFGVAVPNRADPWTRMSYADSNKPIAPIDDPHQMLGKLYGQMKDKASVVSVLDDVTANLKRISSKLSAEDKALLDQHLTLVREMEHDLKNTSTDKLAHPEPELDPEIELVNDNTPQISRMQIDLLVNSFTNDMTRVATLQFMRSVGQARMRWLGIEDGHHGLSHEPDENESAHEKLQRINMWFANELAYLTKKLAETPEPGADGSMLDNTQIVWVNELGKGNSHTLDNIPFVLLGGGCGFNTGRSLDFKRTPHNRLWLSIAQAMGNDIDTFGMPKFCEDGALDLHS